jgi:hypothetical protein
MQLATPIIENLHHPSMVNFATTGQLAVLDNPQSASALNPVFHVAIELSSGMPMLS